MAQSFVQLYFGQPIDDITPADITKFFSEERPESINLEFKSFAQREGDIKHKVKGVLRTICAFLNSEGGLLVWGAPEGSKNNQGEKVFTGPLSPVTTYYSKESFISKLTSQIKDIPIGIRFKDVKVGDNEYVYLIDVPESEFKPHQVEDTYHYRHDGQTQPAPHFLVRALFNQVRRPVLSIEVSALRFLPYSPMTRDDSEVELHLTVKIFNLTESVNEKNLYYRIQSSEGNFIKDKRFDYVAKDVLREGVRTILPSGLEATFEETLKYKYSSSDDDAFINITITAGGELSIPFIRTFHYLLVRKVDERGHVVDVGLLSHTSDGREERNPLRSL